MQAIKFTAVKLKLAMSQHGIRSRQHGNWIVNLFVLLLCDINEILPDCNPKENDPNLPSDWPCSWTNSQIPFALDYFTTTDMIPDKYRKNPKQPINSIGQLELDSLTPATTDEIGPRRIVSVVNKGLLYLQSRSCLLFTEKNPIELAKKVNLTYLYFTYSEVLESCCLPFYTKSTGRRLILITPTCTLPADIAHVTLHGMGMRHNKREPFSEIKTKAVAFSRKCKEYTQRLQAFHSIVP